MLNTFVEMVRTRHIHCTHKERDRERERQLCGDGISNFVGFAILKLVLNVCYPTTAAAVAKHYSTTISFRFACFRSHLFDTNCYPYIHLWGAQKQCFEFNRFSVCCTSFRLWHLFLYVCACIHMDFGMNINFKHTQ